MRHLALGLVIAIASVGCGSEDPAGSGGAGAGTGQGGGGGSGGSAPVNYCAASGSADVGDVSGRWAYLEVLAEVAVAPGFSSPIHSRTITVAVLDLTQAGGDASMSGPLCDVYVEDPESPAHAVIPDPFWDVFSPVSRTATFLGSDGSFSAPPYYQVGGAELADLETEDLPTEPDDPRVRDHDGDTKPGLTSPVTGLFDGEIYMALRRMTQLDGVAVSADSIQGKAMFIAERALLASDPPSIKDSLSASQNGVDPEECTSYFRMARVADADDCASVMERMDSLFP